MSSDAWIQRATTVETESESIRCIDNAEAAATSACELNSILQSMLDHEIGTKAQLQRIVEKTVAASCEEHSVWGFRNAATALLIHDDPSGARQVLEQGVKTFTQPDLAESTGGNLGCNLGLLAEGFVEILDDRQAAIDCLEILRRRATEQQNVGDLCEVAGRYSSCIGDTATARQILNFAEQIETTDRVAWTLADGWFAMGDVDRAEQTLRQVLESCASTDEAIYIASAFHSHGNPDGVRDCIDVAKAQATDVADWLSIAQHCHEFEMTADTRRALKAATELADENSMVTVARGYRLWLADYRTADRLAPRGFRPAEMAEPRQQVPGMTGSANALFDFLRKQLSDKQVQTIAEADYGSDSKQHRAAILDIRDSGRVPSELPWEPREVFELTRWGCGPDVDHASQAFCVSVLLLCEDHDDDNVPALVGSCLNVGDEAAVLAGQFLVWLFEASDVDDPRIFCLLGLGLILAAQDPVNPLLTQMGSLIEDYAADEENFDGGGMPTIFNFCTSRERWAALINQYWRQNAGQNPELGKLADLCGLG